MDLYKELKTKLIKREHSFISITGGGGKTTFMIEFGAYLKSAGYSVLLTTTTKVASPKNRDYKADVIYSDESVLLDEASKGKCVFYANKSIDTKKWIAPRPEVLAVLAKRFDVILCEADGSRGLPLKYHTERDPVINEATTAIVAVMGIWGVGYKAYEVAFGDERGCIVDSAYLNEYLRDSEGLLKGMREGYVNVVLFNGADKVSCEVLDTIKSLNIPSLVSSSYIVSEEKNELYI